MKKCVCLLSGGIDSAVALASVKEEYEQIHSLFVDYGQRNREVEMAASRHLANALGSLHREIELPCLRDFSQELGSALSGVGQELPRVSHLDLEDEELAQRTASAVYVPARNTVLLAIAASFSESLRGAVSIVHGGHATDAVTFPDTTPDFFSGWRQVLKHASKHADISLITPLSGREKHEVVLLAKELGILDLLAFANSCYEGHGLEDGKPVHCPRPIPGEPSRACEACVRRMDAFEKAGVRDPTIYLES